LVVSVLGVNLKEPDYLILILVLRFLSGHQALDWRRYATCCDTFNG
jgi:hypothetical protein